MNKYYSLSFAQAYGENAYGNCAYNENTGTCATGGTAGGTTGGGSNNLADTGFLVLVIVTLASVVIFVSILVRYWRRTSKAQLQPAEVEVEEIDARITDR